MIHQYWWGVENGKKKIAWMSWDKLRIPKSMRGMGFMDLMSFNQTMLGVVGRPDMVKKLGRTRISLSGGFQFGLAVTAGLAHH